MYRCLDCGGLWLESELAVVNTPNYHGVEIGWEDYYTACCPRCGSEDVEEVIDFEEAEDPAEDDGEGVPAASGYQQIGALEDARKPGEVQAFPGQPVTAYTVPAFRPSGPQAAAGAGDL